MSKDVEYAENPIQYVYNALERLVNQAEKSNSKIVSVDVSTLNKIKVVYAGVLEQYLEHTAVGLNIYGKRYACSEPLQAAIEPILDEHYRRSAEKDVDDMIALMEKEKNK